MKKNSLPRAHVQWIDKTNGQFADSLMNIKLVSGRVSWWCLLVLSFPCVYDPLVSRVAAAAAATNF